jgi:hypothetical protein
VETGVEDFTKVLEVKALAAAALLMRIQAMSR